VLCAVLLIITAVPIAVIFATNVANEAELKTALSKGEAVTLTEDITVTGSNWPSYTYNGTFNGNGHVIKGLTSPLFASLGTSAKVSNLGVCAASSILTPSTLANMALLAGTSQGQITSCFAYGDIVYNGTGVVGGLVADITAGSVKDSFTCVNITANSASHVGGFAGKISAGSVQACYSSGSVSASKAGTLTAGFANLIGGSATDTYSSCQLLKSTVNAKPSGVNGLYDNQMSLVRDSKAYPGVSTEQLIGMKSIPAPYSALSMDYFAVTSTAYPALKTFYAPSWCETAQYVVMVSTAAVAFSDIEGESVRYEPTSLSDAFVARTDYLTSHTYADKTNMKSLYWSVDSTSCKMYDTVPLTSMSDSTADTFTAGTHASLLRSVLEFSANVDGAKLTATAGDVHRTWYLTVRTAQNPYFGAYFGDEDTADSNGNGVTDSYPIPDKAKLDYVRYYSMIGPACYKLTANLTLNNWLPIADFDGRFNGNDRSIYDLSFDSSYKGTDFGMFANTQPGATIRNLNMMGVTVDQTNSTEETSIGALIGSTGENTHVEDIVLYGDKNTLKGKHVVGGLVGSSNKTSFKRCLVSVEIEGLGTVGGIVGKMTGGSLLECGSTGYVACGATIGGLAGDIVTNSTTTIKHSYSTAMVVSDMSGALVGGLVGSAGATAFTNCYAANLADAPYGTVHPLRASGTGTLTNSFFDLAYAQNGHESATQKRTTAELIALSWSTTYWTKTSTNYPQLQYFYNKTDGTYTDRLSKLSTTPVYIQNQWNDTTSDDLTTGWIGSVSYLTQPVRLQNFDDGIAHIAPLDSGSGYMFEAGQNQRRVALRSTEKTNTSGVRVIAFVQEDLIPITYSVTGVSGARAYVKLYYGSDATGWKHYEVATVTAGTSEILYNIPKGQKVKVQVECDDAFAVNTVKVTSNSSTNTLSYSNGQYTGTTTYNAALNVAINMKAGSPEWGLRRQSN